MPRDPECAAISTGHCDGPFGPNKETQCKYCGEPPDLIRLVITPFEGAVIRTLLEAAMEQFDAAADADRYAPAIQRTRAMCERLLPYLPKVSE